MTPLTGEIRRVADVILDRILGGVYPSGLRLPPETALAEELGCGRSTIREALRHLASLGVVQSRRGSGVLVLDYRREGTPALLPMVLTRGHLPEAQRAAVAREMLRLRTLMACEAVRLAAKYATDIGVAREHLERAPSLDADPSAHALNELDLYRELTIASGISPAVWMVNAFWAPLREVNALLAPMMGQVDPEFQATMNELLRRVEQHDEEGAMTLVESWFERVDARLLEVIEGVWPGGAS